MLPEMKPGECSGPVAILHQRQVLIHAMLVWQHALHCVECQKLPCGSRECCLSQHFQPDLLPAAKAGRVKKQIKIYIYTHLALPFLLENPRPSFGRRLGFLTPKLSQASPPKQRQVIRESNRWPTKHQGSRLEQSPRDG